MLRDAQMNSETVNEFINLTNMFNAENVLKGTSLKEVQNQKAIILKNVQHLKAVYHCLREKRIFVIEIIDLSDKLGKNVFAFLNFTIKTMEEKHLMSPVFDNLDKLVIQAKAREYFNWILSIKYQISLTCLICCIKIFLTG